MIAYFSGSGNSKYIALEIAKLTNQNILSLNDRIKYNDTETFGDVDTLILSVPIYAWRIPKIVEEQIKSMKLHKSCRIYFIVTTCGSSGNAAKYAKEFCESINCEFMGLATIFMPGTYIAFMENPSKEQEIICKEKAKSQIVQIAKCINSKCALPDENVTVTGKFCSDILNPVFYKHIFNRKGFYATDKCVGCGICEKVCPINNIKVINSLPKWQDSCLHCMACIHHCPQHAIEFRNITRKKNRYLCECPNK